MTVAFENIWSPGSGLFCSTVWKWAENKIHNDKQEMRHCAEHITAYSQNLNFKDKEIEA